MNTAQNHADHHPFIFSRSFDWPGLSLKHWRATRGVMEECSFPAHQIGVTISGFAVTSRQTASGNHCTVMRTPGNLCVVPSGQMVSLDFSEETECLSLFVEPQLVTRAAAEAMLPERVELIELCDKPDPLIQHIAMTLRREAEADEPSGRLYAESLIQTLAFHLVRHYTVNGRQAQTFNGGLPGHRLRRAKEFMHEHLEDELTLDEIAEAVGLSPFHFARAFKRTTGLTPQQYLWQTRIEHAKRLLADAELPLIEVSARTGFKNQSHFTTLFRKFTAMTPRAYRNAMLS
jgi:AraC family transcriptional regulator